ncbi:hypothetical protein ALC57_14029 [Trachymyrmex cornetzi]|uniref:Uncharacterized protein n=1 Tax=Trachymyrmex cornetzi TaxID=471704 RepID=A0A195DM38_9HYME|nr:hypothetical protein ALC57_14029 [Trachymyrmex cornetzi]
MTSYTFIVPDSGPSVRTRVTLQHNISSSWDHHRNYPLMPIHKSVGHFQSPARNSRRNTTIVHSHTNATSVTTVAFGRTYTNFRWGQAGAKVEGRGMVGPKAHRSFMGHLLGIPVKPTSSRRCAALRRNLGDVTTAIRLA